MHGGVATAIAKLLADVGIAHSSDLPSPIEMLEALPDESALGLIPENQVGVGHRPVLAEVPGFADLEVTQEVCLYVASEWDGHMRVEQFLGLFEVGIESRQVEKSELGELPKERAVGFEVVRKSREVCLLPLEVGERHHRRKSVIT